MLRTLLVAVLAAAVKCDRTINWYISIDANKTINEANAAAVKGHTALFSQLQLAWQPGMPANGSLAGWHNEAAVHEWLSVYKPTGVPIVPVVVNMVNGTAFRELYKDPVGYANELVAIGKRYGFVGFNFDYEPQHPRDRHAEDYAKFLTAVNKVLVAHGFTLSIWVAQWSDALNKYGELAESGIQRLQDMSTYGGFPMPLLRDTLDHFTNSIKAKRGNVSQAGVGLGPYHTHFWNEKNLEEFINHATSRGVTNLDIFRVLMDGVNNWPPPYWYTVLEKFMKGEI